MHLPSKHNLSDRLFFSKPKLTTDDYTQFWIRYKPERVLRRRLGKTAKYLFWFNVLLVVALAAAAGAACVSGFQPIYTITLAFLSVLLLYRLRELFLPTHVTLTEDGLQLHWIRMFGQVSGPKIGWDRLSHVSIGKSTGLIGVDKTIEFNVVSRGVSLWQRLGFSLLAPEITDGWLTSDRSLVRLKLDGLASSDDRKRLQISLKKFLPSYRIDSSVTDELNLAIVVESYTDLWLDALSASPKRLRVETLAEGTHIKGGRYQVLRQIGGGGQAVVYEAVERTSAGSGQIRAESVVLKEFVLPAHAGVNVRKRVLSNIQREADMLKALNHPNIVGLHDFFVDDQRAYLVLEHISGSTLKKAVDEHGKLPENEVIRLALQMCDILSYLHGCTPPVVHRDFTPDNLMLDEKNNLKLIDFNVAQHLEADQMKSVVGKHAYIPPEQFRGEATPQSDVYAMGATLFFLLTGIEPEPISQSEPRHSNSEVTDELDRIVARATEPEASRRYTDCRSVKSDLEELPKVRAVPS